MKFESYLSKSTHSTDCLLDWSLHELGREREAERESREGEGDDYREREMQTENREEGEGQGGCAACSVRELEN